MIEPLLILPKPYGPIVGQVVHEISLKFDSAWLKNRISIQFQVKLVQPADSGLTTLVMSSAMVASSTCYYVKSLFLINFLWKSNWL